MIEQGATRVPGKYIPGAIMFRDSFMPSRKVQAIANRDLPR